MCLKVFLTNIQCFACKSMVKQLFLVGYMGAGKTSTAKALSLRTGHPMIDLDEEFERREGISISDLFEQKGEATFRSKESSLLLDIAGCSSFPIVSCGGGIMANRENVQVMKAHGFVVWIDTPFEEILERLRSNLGKRPLLAAMGYPIEEHQIRAHYEHRREDYANSDERIGELTEEALQALANRINRGV